MTVVTNPEFESKINRGTDGKFGPKIKTHAPGTLPDQPAVRETFNTTRQGALDDGYDMIAECEGGVEVERTDNGYRTIGYEDNPMWPVEFTAQDEYGNPEHPEFVYGIEPDDQRIFNPIDMDDYETCYQEMPSINDFLNGHSDHVRLELNPIDMRDEQDELGYRPTFYSMVCASK